ncbi:MAG: sensor histidine kinase [Phycisphaerae bacterium]|nr:sensor histidine kinase [Phycisphaerae bacterium]
MSTPHAETPRRIPPSGSSPSRTQTVTATSPTSPPEAATVATDTYSLQAQIDQLAQQFDWLKARLRHSQKLATLGTTAAMTAHELNNMLTPVVAYCRDALDRNDPELMRLALSKTLDRAAAMRQMIDRVVGLARQSDTVIKAVNLHQVVEEAIGCLGRDLGKDGIQLNLQIDEKLTVRANENQLLQVLLNLVSNARQAMLGRRGRLSVDAAPTAEGQVQINVRDSGCGIPAEHLDAVFDPFFSTKTNAEKPDQRGLGLGLSISRDIIEEFGGRIEVASQLGVGTTFTVTLPASD